MSLLNQQSGMASSVKLHENYLDTLHEDGTTKDIENKNTQNSTLYYFCDLW